MSDIRTLLFLELRTLFGINKAIHTKDPKAKSRFRTLTLAWVILIAMAAFYVGALVFGLCSIGLSSIVPAYLAVIASAFIVFFGMFNVGGKLFSPKGYDLLASMPLSQNAIVVSRFLGSYIADLALTLVIMLPGIAVYGFCVNPSPLFYVFALIGVLFVPAIPLVLATLFGSIILAISSRMKKKSAVQSLLTVFIAVGIVVLSFSMEGMTSDLTNEELTDLATLVGSALQSVYPPAMWLSRALTDFDILSLALFVLLSLVIVSVTVFIVSKFFTGIIHRLLSFSARHDYKIGKMGSRGLLKSLYVREAKRYFSSSIYVSNTIIGPILGMIMAVALCVVGMDTVQSSFPVDIVGLLPFAFAAVFCMMTTTSVSISMEGKHFWIVKSLPIPTKTLLDSKILLNLSLMLPCYLVSLVALTIATRPNILELVWLIVIPLSLMLFSTVIGITVNLKLYSFDWENEASVVKQSSSAMLGGFAGFLASVGSGLIVLIVPAQLALVAKLAVCVLLLGITAYLYQRNNKKLLSRL